MTGEEWLGEEEGMPEKKKGGKRKEVKGKQRNGQNILRGVEGKNKKTWKLGNLITWSYTRVPVVRRLDTAIQGKSVGKTY